MNLADGTRPPAGSADAIVVAAGASSRMAGVDKVLAEVGGRPLLAWTLAAVAAAPVVGRIVVVVAPDSVALIRGAAWLPTAVRAIVPGGRRRQESVAAGLAALEALGRDPVTAEAGETGPLDGGRGTPGEDRVILVHDGARPCPSPGLFERVAAAAAEHGAAIPVVPIVETVKRVDDGSVVTTVDRSSLAAAQTPQGVRRSLLRAAFERYPPDGPREWTDEASLLEACRLEVHAIPGEPANVKVTTPDDLGRVERTLPGVSRLRVGYGDDVHPFGPGGPLALGGIAIDGAPRLHGHSDGDVALHAIADALLGAAGLGDLGRLFPAGPATPRGVASAELIGEVLTRLAAVGLRPASVDLTIVGARPRLGDRLEAMRTAIAALLGIPVGAVSVKASTGNLTGSEGAGRSIGARAVAVVEPAR